MKMRIAGLIIAVCVCGVWAAAQGVTGVLGSTNGSANCGCVKNQPYSADTIMITDRVLADGNRIHQETHGKMYRDSEGRTRTETDLKPPAGAPPRTTVRISDPVNRTSIQLEEDIQTAIVSHFGQPYSATITRTQTSTGVVSANVTVEPSVSRPNLTPPANLPKSSRDDLGTQTVEGLLAHGWRTTTTVPAGVQGNEQPLTTVSETWTAEDLQLVVLNKTDSPQNGKMERRLTNIQRADPDPALFQVPADYKVKEVPQ